MKSEHYIGVLLTASMLLPSIVFAQTSTATVTPPLPKPPKKLEFERDGKTPLNLKVKMEEKQNKRLETVKDRLGKVVATLENHISKIAENQVKISGHLDRFAARGINVTASRAELAKGVAELEKAKTALAAAKAKIATMTEGTKELAKAVRAEIDPVQKQIRLAHEVTMESLRVLRADMKSHDDKREGERNKEREKEGDNNGTSTVRE